MYRLDWSSRWATYAPHKVAIKEHETGRTLTYRQLNNAAGHVARRLTTELGLKKGDRVAILSENRLEHFILFAMAQKTGLILVPLNFRLAPRELDFLLTDSGAALLIAEEAFSDTLAQVPTAKRIPQAGMETLAEWWPPLSEQEADFPTDETVSEDDPVFILYTSGTTGFPKGALYTHKMLFWNSVNTALRLDLTSGDRTITCLPLFHTGGWNVLSTPFLHRGAYFCLTRKFEPELILQLLEAEQATIFMGVPTMLKMMAASPRFESANLSSVRYFIVGGEAMPLPLIEQWHGKGVPIRQGYGLTEVGPNLTSLHQDDAVRKMGSIGLPNFYVDIRIVDDAGRDVPRGDVGELLLKGPMVTPGYWNNPEATAEALAGGWFHTGDLVRQDEEGYLFVVDRKKNMYISGGENVYPAEVEKFLFTHPEIADVAVIGVPDEKWGEVGKAYIVRKPGSRLTAEAVWEFCRGQLAKYKIPKHIEFVETLPKGDTGKIDRRALQQRHRT
ncbi:MAG: long-chain-fatty-acid--CoA ligase [Calditrichaeota bacterium]|nr:MAG: long-chain-fatty-acid--CoA ligase [Calditrichota bacterium]